MTSMHLFHMESFKSAFQTNIQLLVSILEKQYVVQGKLKELKNNYDKMVRNNKKKYFYFVWILIIFNIKHC